MQIRIVVEVISMAVVGKGMLMLPHNGITQEGYSPQTYIVEEGDTAGCKMSRIVTEASNEPSKYRKKDGSNWFTFDVKRT